MEYTTPKVTSTLSGGSMTRFLKFPFYAKVSLLIIGLYVTISILSIAQSILVPLLFATIIAILLSPVVNFLVRKKINRVVAITGALTVAILILSALVVLLLSQASLLSDAMPQLTEKFGELLNKTVTWVSDNFNTRERKINEWLASTKDEFVNNSSGIIGSTLSTMGSVLTYVFLTPVYIFMILFYQPHLIRFVHQLFGTSNDVHVGEILVETKTIIQSYLAGLAAEFAIVAILNSAGLLLLGIQYALLLGIVGALLNIIPYIGGLIGMAIFVMIALVTKSPVYVLYVMLLYSFIQLIDNNYLVPKIIGSKVKLNALVSLLAVIAGAALWGIPGMFLSIPLTAIIKLILDRIHSLKPWGFLMGDTMPPIVKLKLNLKNISKRLPKPSSSLTRKQTLE